MFFNDYYHYSYFNNELNSMPMWMRAERYQYCENYNEIRHLMISKPSFITTIKTKFKIK